jgi:transcriptional antiterminator RfaH
MQRWYVVHTHAAAEERARRNLVRQGFEVWLPECRRRRRHARKVETVRRPLFPRYLFVRLDPAGQRWRPILSTYGVATMITGADGPVPVPPAVIEALSSRAAPDGLFDLEPAPFRPGDLVRVSGGPFAEMEGIFSAESDATRVQVLLRLMGREVKVTVDAVDLRNP